jgi:hypothetical protein
LLQKTALLLFTRTAALEAAHKAFVPAKFRQGNLKIASHLVCNSRKIARSANLPVHEVNEDKQVGESFGERLSNAIEGVFEKGFENVVIIGNDCPQLTVDGINAAAHQLQQHDVVLGPDNRGGVYLIALSKKIFNRDRFAAARWQTTGLLQDLLSLFNQNAPYTLSPFKDVNRFEDLIQIKDLLPLSHKLIALVVSMLASFCNKYNWLQIGCNSIHFSISGLRSPPCFTPPYY